MIGVGIPVTNNTLPVVGHGHGLKVKWRLGGGGGLTIVDLDLTAPYGVQTHDAWGLKSARPSVTLGITGKKASAVMI